MKIAFYAQNTALAGKVCYDEEMIESQSDDLVFWDGEPADLARKAQQIVDRGAKNSNELFLFRVANNALEELDCPVNVSVNEEYAWRGFDEDEGRRVFDALDSVAGDPGDENEVALVSGRKTIAQKTIVSD